MSDEELTSSDLFQKIAPPASGMGKKSIALTADYEQRVPLGQLRFGLLYFVIVLSLAAYLLLNVQVAEELIAKAEANPILKLLVGPSLFWGALMFLLTGFRTVVWFCYRPAASCTFDDAPPITVIIPAYNEGQMVLKSIRSVVNCHYPVDRLEIFVIDDGSKDDTWRYIQEAVQQLPERITAIQFPKNRGKRAALALGFEKAKGEFAVTLDSDSVLDPNALLAIVGPFRNPRIGAVAGKVSVYNLGEGALPKMLHTRFVLTFDVMRAVESSYGTVYCTPGALSAYRVSAVRKVLSRWMTQSFLGSRCTYGEDRALTNDLLAEGFDTCYQRSAVVYTVVPANYSKMCRMFLRWDRSYVREEIRFMKIVWTRPPLARILSIFDRMTTNLRYPVSFMGIIAMITMAFITPFNLIRFFLVMLFISIFNSLYYLRSEASFSGFTYSIAFSFFSTFAMWWIMPYALFTVRSKGWLTR